MDKSNKVFLDSFVLGIACGVQRCLEALSRSEVGRKKDSLDKTPGCDTELQHFLKVIADVLNNFGEKSEDEADIQSSPFRSILEMNDTSPEKSLGATGIGQQMSGVFEELVQTFRQLICNYSEINLLPSDSSKHAKSDMSRELCHVLQDMEGILTQIVDDLKSDENMVRCSTLSDVNCHPSEKTNETTDDSEEGNISSVTREETGSSTVPMALTFEDDAEDRTDSVIDPTGNYNDIVEENLGGEKRSNEEVWEDKVDEEMWNSCDESRSSMDQEIISERMSAMSLSDGEPVFEHECMEGMKVELACDYMMQNDEMETKYVEYDACGEVVTTNHTDKNDSTFRKNSDGENPNQREELEHRSHDEIWSDCEESKSDVNQDIAPAMNVVGQLLEGETSEVGDEDTADEVTTGMKYDSFVPTEDEDLTSEVSKERELLELSAVRKFREHMDRDGLDVEIFRTPRDQSTKHPRYTCRLLGFEAVACGRSKRAAKRKALCKMVHLLVKKHKEGCLPKEISPFTNEELWALEDVCVGGDDYLSKLQQLCNLEKVPPPVFDVQISKGSVGNKTFIVKCSALGRTAVGMCSRKRSAKRHAAREIVKQHEQEKAAAAATELATIE